MLPCFAAMCESDLHCVCASLCHSLKKITLNGVIEEKSKLAITVFLSFSFRNFFSNETFHLCHIFSCLVIPNNAAIRLLAGSWSCVRCNVSIGSGPSASGREKIRPVISSWQTCNLPLSSPWLDQRKRKIKQGGNKKHQHIINNGGDDVKCISDTLKY